MPLMLKVRNGAKFYERGVNAVDRGAGSSSLPLSQLEYYKFLQYPAHSAIQSNESFLKSNLPLLLQERDADNVKIQKWNRGGMEGPR